MPFRNVIVNLNPVLPYRLAALLFDSFIGFSRTPKKSSNTNHEYQKKHSLLTSAQAMRITERKLAHGFIFFRIASLLGVHLRYPSEPRFCIRSKCRQSRRPRPTTMMTSKANCRPKARGCNFRRMIRRWLQTW